MTHEVVQGEGQQEPKSVAFNGLLLTEGQVWPGMRVALCLEGKDKVEVDETGDPLILDALVGGVPARTKLYPVKGGITQHPGGALTASPLEGFRPEVRFMPVEVFHPDEVPAKTVFAVYREGQCLKYDGSRNHIIVKSDEGGRLQSNNGYEYRFWQREYTVPEGSLLVPISRPKGLDARQPVSARR